MIWVLFLAAVFLAVGLRKRMESWVRYAIIMVAATGTLAVVFIQFYLS